MVSKRKKQKIAKEVQRRLRKPRSPQYYGKRSPKRGKMKGFKD